MPVHIGSQYRRVIADRSHCNTYTILNGQDGQNIQKQCKMTLDESTHLLGDGSHSSANTKVNRAVHIVRHLRGGKIVYGDNGLASPFSDPSTIDDTDVSRHYSTYSSARPPIVNGIRGGVVPARTRKNQF
jgi:hypothetical protein